MFSPKNEREELIYAIEGLKADVQYEMLRALKENGVTQKEISKRLRVSQARVSQMLGDDGNLTIENIARFFHALNEGVSFSVKKRGGEGHGVNADISRQSPWRPTREGWREESAMENPARTDSHRWSFAHIGADRPQRLISHGEGRDLSNDNGKTRRAQSNAA